MFGPFPDLLQPASQPLLQAIQEADNLGPALILRLRKHWTADTVQAAIALVIARRKAAGKFPRPEQLLLEPVAVEQASSATLADHKARRFAELAPEAPILDLGCGIGGDAMSLARVRDLILFDANPQRLWMARHNVLATTGRLCPAAVADITTLRLDGQPFHIDPDRRTGPTRLQRYADYLPGPAFIDRLLRHCPDGAVKLGPGVDFSELPPGEVEVISERGTPVQAVLWTGRLARAPRSATMLPAGVTIAGEPCRLRTAPPKRYLFTVDPAVERADLLGLLARQLELPAIHPALGLLTADQPIDHPMLTGFQLLETLPWRLKKVRTWLRAHDAGLVEIKTRGKAVNPDIVQQQLRGPGSTPYTLFILRLDQKVLAFITRRLHIPG